MNNKDVVPLVISVVSAVISLGAWVLTLTQNRWMKDQSYGNNILTCVKIYNELASIRDEAYKHKSEAESAELYKKYCQSLFELNFIQFHLYKLRQLPKSVMLEWMSLRAKSFNSDKFNESISYKSMWEQYKNNTKSDQKDEFIHFMDTVHTGKVYKAL